jgi:hypothetical protein
MDAQIGFAKALRRVFPTMVASYLEFRGWIHQDARCNGLSVAVLLRQCPVGLIVVNQQGH